MNKYNQALTLEDFINAACKLYNTLCVSDKSEILKFNCEKKIPYNQLSFHVIFVVDSLA